jgi:hypothetical protein
LPRFLSRNRGFSADFMQKVTLSELRYSEGSRELEDLPPPEILRSTSG